MFSYAYIGASIFHYLFIHSGLDGCGVDHILDVCPRKIYKIVFKSKIYKNDNLSYW